MTAQLSRRDGVVLFGSVLFASLLMAMLSAQPIAASPLLNPGFEAGTLPPWFQGIGTLDQPHDEFWDVTTATANSGSWSASNIGNNELRQDFAPIPTAAIVDVSLYLRKEGVIGLQSAVQLHYLDGSFSQHILFASQFDLWEKHDLTNDLTAGQQLVGISVFGVRSDVPTRTYVDDFAIVVPEPRSAALLLMGLLGLARRRLLQGGGGR